MPKMKKILRYILWLSGILIAIPIIYLIIALVFSYIPQNYSSQKNSEKKVYISTNGVHLEIILKKEDLDSLIYQAIEKERDDEYFSFGWGEKNFYLNTPTWGDLTFSTAFRAAFLKNESLVHIYRYETTKTDWKSIPVSTQQLESINNYLKHSFRFTEYTGVRIIPEASYGHNDEFYEGNGQYSYRNTCNSWVNRCLYESGLPCCLWTPFDFAVMRLYEK
jgi:uncharacterized protein (TIGR02117 family)